MEVRQEHMAEDGTVTDSKDEDNKVIIKSRNLIIDELQEQAEQNELIIAELRTDKRLLQQEGKLLWENLFQKDDLINQGHKVIAEKEKKIVELGEEVNRLMLSLYDESKVKLLTENGRLRDRMIEIRRILKDSEELLLP